MKSKGQVFIVAAVIFSSLIIATVASMGSFIQGGEETFFRDYFEQSMEQPVSAFNSGIEQNGTSGYIEKKIYNSNRFLLIQTKRKGIDYSSMQFFVLPDKGEAVLINYKESSISPSIRINGGWENRTVEAKQSSTYNFKKGQVDLRVVLEEYELDRGFKANNPRILVRSSMNSDRESWVNSRLH